MMPKVPYVPRLRVLPYPPHSRVLSIPTRAVYPTYLDPKALADFDVRMFDRRATAEEIPDLMRMMAAGDRDTYQSRFNEAILPIVDSALSSHRKDFGLDPRKWSPTSLAQRAVYTIDLAPEEGGHAVAVVSLEGLTDPESAVRDPRLMRCVTGAFPGQFAALPDDIFLQVMRAGRESDGTLPDIIGDNWPRIVSYNAGLFDDGTPMAGMHAIGWNSFIGAETHYTVPGSGLLVQSSLMVTGPVHSQRGIVPYTVIAHPDFPGGVVCLSLHFGKNRVPGGDLVNSAIPSSLFKTLFRGGVSLYGMRDELIDRYGRAIANGLLLEPTMERAFRAYWNERDFALNSDRTYFSVLDRTGGAVLSKIGMFFPTTVSTVDSARYNAVKDIAQYEAIIDEGVRLSTEQGVSTGGLLPETPDQVVPDLGPSTTGLEVRHTPDTDPFNPTAPLGEPFDGSGTALSRAAGELDSDLIERVAGQEIADRTRASLDRSSFPLDRDPGELAEAIADAAFRTGLRERLTATFLSGLAAHPDGKQALERYGVAGTDALVELAVTGPLIDRMTRATGDSSYLARAVQQVVLETRAHALAESAGEIQQRLTAAADTVRETSQEIEARESAFLEAQREADLRPDDPAVQQRRDALRQEINALARKLDEAERARTEADKDREINGERARKTEESAEETKSYLEAHRTKVFGGGHDVVTA